MDPLNSSFSLQWIIRETKTHKQQNQKTQTNIQTDRQTDTRRASVYVIGARDQAAQPSANGCGAIFENYGGLTPSKKIHAHAKNKNP